MVHALPEQEGLVAARLHALPSEIAELAKAAEVEHLVPSHLMRLSERALDESPARIEGDPLPATTLFWFAWYAFHPETEVYRAD
jgi:hypothetical protein